MAASLGRTVVLVHGMGVSSRYMAPLALQLASSFRVLVPDLPGFGRSAKPKGGPNLDHFADALANLLDHESTDRAALVGNSFGCQVIVHFALRHPERLARAVLQGPTMDPEASIPHQLVRWLWAGLREPPSLHAVLLRDFIDCGFRRALATYRLAARDPLREKLARVRTPTLVVRGGRDLIAPQRWAAEVACRIPGARLIVVPGAAHTMNYGSPEVFARTITPFLNEKEIASPLRTS
jgi:pimeloyl-ACP methyl ester carboxylesterase